METKGVKEKQCPKCGASYKCYSEAGVPCWCQNFSIKNENLKLLAEKYNGCLCPDCLSLYGKKKKEKFGGD